MTVTRKLSPGLDPDAARQDVRALRSWRPLPMTGDLIDNAWKIQDRFGLSFWDALIVAAAGAAGCDRLLTEDLQDGQRFDGVLVVDPFAHEPGAARAV